MKDRNAEQQLKRILDIIPRLADGQDHPIEEASRAAGVDWQTLVDDLRALSERNDAPGGFVEGVQIFLTGNRAVCIIASDFLRPVRLTMPELAALELGLVLLRAERPREEHRSIDGAIARLRGMIAKTPQENRREPTRWGDLTMTGSAELLAVLRDALRERRAVRIVYRGTAGTSDDDRTIHPYSLVFSSGTWYAVAWCVRSTDLRIFRLDRIAKAAHADDRYTIPADFSVDKLVAEGRVFHEGAAAANSMTIRYSPRIARWIAERERQPLSPDGSLTLTHRLADVEWGVRHALQYADDAEVLAPESVRTIIRERLARLTGT